MARVYMCEAVRRVRELHRSLLSEYPGNLSVGAVLRRQAETLYTEHRLRNSAVCVQLSNWLPDCVGLDEEHILKRRIDPGDALLTVAREHGFNSWRAVQDVSDRKLVVSFEHAVDALLAGEEEALRQMIKDEPHLVRWRSGYGHRATLLHYLTANGVETWRQVVPENAPELASLLIREGADPSATASMYGGAWDPLALAGSSAHPRNAGVVEALTAALQKRA
jgi:hypothetical protein